jgi:hypothetical protein
MIVALAWDPGARMLCLGWYEHSLPSLTKAVPILNVCAAFPFTYWSFFDRSIYRILIFDLACCRQEDTLLDLRTRLTFETQFERLPPWNCLDGWRCKVGTGASCSEKKSEVPDLAVYCLWHFRDCFSLILLSASLFISFVVVRWFVLSCQREDGNF